MAGRAMARWTGTTGLAAAAALGLALLGSEALAESSQLDRVLNNQLRSNRTGVDVRVIEQRQRRMDFQERQQRYREQDRINAGRPRPRLEVPIMRGSCQTPIEGSRAMRRNCR